LKKNLLQNQQADLNQAWYKPFLREGIQVYSNKGPSLLQRDNHKSAKIGWVNLHIFFS
jgi:hypothetical protein